MKQSLSDKDLSRLICEALQEQTASAEPPADGLHRLLMMVNLFRYHPPSRGPCQPAEAPAKHFQDASASLAWFARGVPLLIGPR